MSFDLFWFFFLKKTFAAYPPPPLVWCWLPLLGGAASSSLLLCKVFPLRCESAGLICANVFSCERAEVDEASG